MAKLIQLHNQVFTSLTVVDEAPKKGAYRMWNCSCLCGSSIVVRQSSLRNGHTRSCGCIQIEAVTTHGLTSHKLFKHWTGMKDRSKQREACKVYSEWEDFTTFFDWAITSGWKEGLHLCRIGDVGNYEPNNVRWDTAQSNVEESLAKHYVFISPIGEEVLIYNLSKFCRLNKLDNRCMFAVHHNKLRQYKGWTKTNPSIRRLVK